MSNIVIIGSGPAGVSAALYAARAGVQTTVLTKGPGALDRAELIQNYYGFAAPISGAELERQVVLVQLFQQTARGELLQLSQVVPHVVLHGIPGGREQGVPKILPVFQLPEAVFQSLNNGRLIFRAHCPDRHRPCKPAFMGIRNVKVVFEPGASDSISVKDGNAGCPTIDPTPETLIPAVFTLNRQDGGSVRALSI